MFFHQKYSNLEFLYYLANRMTNPKPEQRPSEEMALQYFEESVKSMSPAALRWRLKPRDEKIVFAVVRDIHSAALEVKHQIMRVTCALLFHTSMSVSSRLTGLISIHYSQSPT
jgi:hypothetical protein